MATVPVEVVVSVQDRFSADLKRAGTATNEFAREVRQTQQVFSAMSQEITSRLAPGLQTLVVSIGGAAREAKGLSAGMGALTIGVAAVAAGVGLYVDSLKRAAAQQAELNAAIRRFDTGTLATGIERARGEIEKLAELEKNGVMGKIVAGLSRVGEIMKQTFTRERTNEKVVEDFGAAFEKAAGPERAKQLAEIAAGFNAVKQAAAQATAAQQLSLGQVGPSLRSLDEAIAQAKKRAQQEDIARRADLDVAVSRAPTDQQKDFLRKAFDAQTPMIAQRRRMEIEQFAVQQSNMARQALEAAFARDSAFIEGSAEGMLAGVSQEDRMRMMLQEAKNLAEGVRQIERELAIYGVEGGAEGAMAGNTPADNAASAAVTVQMRTRDLAIQREMLATDAERVEIAGRMQTFSADQRDALAMEVSANRELLKLKDLQAQVDEALARNDYERVEILRRLQSNVRLEGAVERQGIDRGRALRTDGAFGLSEGFREAQLEMEQAGTAMYDSARRTARNIYQAFDDGFFALFTGRAKEMPNIMKQFGQQMLRELTGELARQSTAPAVGLIRAALGGGLGRAGFDLGPGASQAIGAPGASGIPGAVNLAGMSSVQVQALANQGYTVTATAAGPVAVPSASAQSGMYGQASAAAARVGDAVRQFFATPVFTPSSARAYQAMQARATTPEEAAFLEANAPMESGSYVGSGGQNGMSYGDMAGAGIMGLAQAYQIFQGYSDPNQNPTTESVVFGTLGSTATGAQIGGQVGGGWGAAVGAIVGFVAGLTSSAKTGSNVTMDARRKKRLGDSAFVYQGVLAAINSAVDREEAARMLVPSQEGVNLTIGQLLASISAHNISGDFTIWGWPPAEIARKVLGYMMQIGIKPREFNNGKRGTNNTVELVANFGAQERQDGRPRNDPLEGARNAERLLQAFWAKRSKVYIQFSEDLDQAGARGSARQVTRTSVLNYERRGEAAGQQISLLAESVSGLDADQGRRVLETLMKIDYDHNIGAFRTERNGGAQVSVGLSTVRFGGQVVSPIPTVALPA